jgi:hypothetical protein
MPAVVSFLFVMLFLLTETAFAFLDPIPPQIKGVTMGASKESVIAKIKGSGTYTTSHIEKENRTRVTWVPAKDQYYSDVVFQFTEKDRLYLIRFNLYPAMRSKAAELKQAFFRLFGYYEEHPMRLRVKNSEVLLYGPGEAKDFLLEYTDRTTGQKGFEMFDRQVSGSDRPQPPKAEGKAGPAPVSTEAAPPGVSTGSHPAAHPQH